MQLVLNKATHVKALTNALEVVADFTQDMMISPDGLSYEERQQYLDDLVSASRWLGVLSTAKFSGQDTLAISLKDSETGTVLRACEMFTIQFEDTIGDGVEDDDLQTFIALTEISGKLKL